VAVCPAGSRPPGQPGSAEDRCGVPGIDALVGWFDLDDAHIFGAADGRLVLSECAGSAAQAGGAGPLHCLGAVVDLEFGEYVAYVVADGFG
jgi:hypothetical protein